MTWGALGKPAAPFAYNGRMFFFVSNLSGSVIEIADPSPIDGGYQVYVKATGNQYFEATDAQFDRIIPALQNLEQRGLITWDRAADLYPPVADVRQRGVLPWQPYLNTISPSQISAASAASLVVSFQGYGLLSNFVQATAHVGKGAGTVNYAAANVSSSYNNFKIYHNKPGPNTALSAHLGSDYASIVVTLGTNSSGVVTSTAAQVVTAVNAALYVPYYAIATVGTAGTAQPGVVTLQGGTGPSFGYGYVFAGFGGNASLITDQEIRFDFTGMFNSGSFTPGKFYVFQLSLGLNYVLQIPIPVVA